MNIKSVIKESIFSFILSIIIIYTYASNGPDCFSGFPIKFWSICMDVGPIPYRIIISGFFLNFIFWFVLLFISLQVLRVLSKKRFSKYFLSPFFLTIVSLSFYEECTGMFCISEGYGFPLGYYYNGVFSVNTFLIDFIFILILNFVFIKVKNLLFFLISRRRA